MQTIHTFLIASAVGLATAIATAQPGPGPGGKGPGGRWGADFTPGWGMMTPQERREHQSKMQSMKTYDECRSYMDEHHKAMVERSTSKGAAVPGKPRRDACAGLKQ
jgi:hypothetical protein